MGSAEGVGVNGMTVPVIGGRGEGEAVGEDEGMTVGRNSVGDSRGAAIAWVGDGRTPDMSSWLNRKPPNSMPTLTSVTTKPPSS